MLSSIKQKLRYLFYHRLSQKEERNLLLLANLCLGKTKVKGPVDSLKEVELRVFSQWGEDGIIQYIIHNIDIPNKVFVEFGVENYEEANTRFLLVNDNWSGLVIDGSEKHINFIKNDPIYAKNDLLASHSFITKDNINQIIQQNIGSGDIGLLSVDIDGNDYWVWQAIDVINPRIVICEYNSILGGDKRVTVPYKPGFYRTSEHHSNLYFGASLGAFCSLAEDKGYDFIGSNSSGVNAFFVRKDLSAPFKKYSCREGYVESKHRESRDSEGNLNFLRGRKRLEAIKDKVLVDLDQSREYSISELYRDEISH
ncbi:hypothetical protein [Pontibacter roseus]|uniref:hypothetical protein n=1 Tax=Pontibacter roseus TaxID=336989 RepID=UPI000360CB61|nr:hypothetical protein [Pontibacter roseus]